MSAAGIEVRGLVKRYGATLAVDDVSFRVAPGSFLAMLGPSGSGKTTVLMTIAGFEMPEAGQVLLGGRDVTRTPPHRRSLGMVFQRYALFPHLSVADNLAYPLHRRGMAGAEIARRVAAMLEMVGLAGLGARLPDQLSGGQQQRVALGRALVYQPPILLMDEPLGALDRKLRDQMQLEIKAIQRQLGTTVVFVTHDQQEALQLADQVAVMRAGRIAQLGTPHQVYEQPASAFVADFVGEANVLRGVVEAGALRLPDGRALPGTNIAGSAGPGALVVRPGAVRVGAGEATEAEVTELVYAGESVAVVAALAHATTLTARLAPAAAAGLARGDRVRLGWSVDAARLFVDDAPTPAMEPPP